MIDRNPGPILLCLSFSLVVGCTPESSTPFAESEVEIINPHVAIEAAEPDQEDVADDVNQWPQLFGPTQQSRSPEQDLVWEWPAEGPQVVWEIPAGTGYAAPVVLDGRVILFHRQKDEEIVACHDAETGEPLWSTSHPTAYECKYPYSSGPYATPVITPEMVYAVGAEGKLVAVRTETGERVWQVSLKETYEVVDPAFGMGSSPVVDEDLLYVHVGGEVPNSGVVAFDRLTGEEAWRAVDDGLAYSTLVVGTVHGRKMLLALTLGKLSGLDATTGEQLWEYPFGITNSPERVNSVTPLLIGDLVFLTQGPGPGSALLHLLPDGTFEEVWKARRTLDSQYTNVIPAGRLLFGVTGFISGRYRAINLQDGKVVWEHDSDLARANGLLLEDRIVLLGEYGHLAQISVEQDSDPTVAWMSDEPLLEHPCFTIPAFANGLLYLRNEQRLQCRQLRQ